MPQKRNYASMMDIDEQSSPSQPSTRQLRSTMPLHGTPESEPESRDVYLAWVVQGLDDFDNVNHVSPHSFALLSSLYVTFSSELPIGMLKNVILETMKVPRQEFRLWQLWKPLIPLPSPDSRGSQAVQDFINDRYFPGVAQLLHMGLVGEVWPHPLPHDHASFLHLIVAQTSKTVLPSIPPKPALNEATSIFQLRRKFVSKIDGIAPSIIVKELSKLQHCDNLQFREFHPFNVALPMPFSLVHPIFARFMQDCSTIVPSRADNLTAHNLSVAMSHSYETKTERMEVFRTIMSEYDLCVDSVTIGDTNYSTDGILYYGSACLLIIEGVNEDTDLTRPRFTASTYYHAIMQEHAKGYPGILPAILMTFSGSLFGITGVIWHDRLAMQDLTGPRLSHRRPDHDAKSYIACTLAALRNAVASLQYYYDTKQHLKTVMNDQPCWDTCRYIQDSTSHTIMYENKPRPSVFKRVWFGCTDDGERICIKFTRFYSTKAHQFMARKGWAPHLLGFQTVPPNWCMVVMKDLRDGYEHLTLSAQDEHKDNWRTLRDAIRQALQALHDAKLVHGDIRRANVMVKPDLSDFKLIVFDCAGEIGKALYPPRYSIDPRIGRLEEAWDGKPIKADHDKLMLQKLSD